VVAVWVCCELGSMNGITVQKKNGEREISNEVQRKVSKAQCSAA